MIIRYKPQAITQCVDVILQVIYNYQKQNKSAWKKLLGQSEAPKADSGSKGKGSAAKDEGKAEDNVENMNFQRQ
jgi:hypothetical protein|tara:strand:- start:93 stop:314 length:222 start_codon:yes stop_codon:yes gene_type:complete